MKTQVILNEQHKLLPEQEKLLNDKFGSEWEIYPVPAEGWDESETALVEWSLRKISGVILVFASPVPLLLAKMTKWVSFYEEHAPGEISVYLFFNSARKKKEILDSKIIYIIPARDWQLIMI